MISIKNISKSFGNEKILDDASFTLEYGKLTALFGKSGCGKTTLANIIAMYLKPDQGKIIMDDMDIFELKGKERRKKRKDIQLISQHPYMAFDPNKTVFNSISEGPLFLKLATKKSIDEYLEQYLDILKIDRDLLDRYPSKLSGGQLQRASIARAIAVKPKLLIADEITSSSDPIMQREIAETMKDLCKLGLSVLFITHNIKLGLYIANDALLLKGGRIYPFSSSEQLQ